VRPTSADPSRRAVVELLGEQSCCLSALEIHERLRIAGPRVGIASVYRALEGLDTLGLVQPRRPG
jgi:Fe2+ or Zn2+ uptake regulation protein